MSTIGWKIKNLREINQWPQLELAKRIGLHNSVLSKIESDKRLIESDLLCKFAEVFQVSTDYLVGRSQHTQSTFDKSYFPGNDPEIYQHIKEEPVPQKKNSSSLQTGSGEMIIKERLTPQQIYYYVASDDSMIQEGITIGTKVLIQGQHYIEEGAMALVSWDNLEAGAGAQANLESRAEAEMRTEEEVKVQAGGSQATLRRAYFIGNQIVLQAANHLIPPVLLPIHAAKILGQVLEYTNKVK